MGIRIEYRLISVQRDLQYVVRVNLLSDWNNCIKIVTPYIVEYGGCMVAAEFTSVAGATVNFHCLQSKNVYVQR